MSEFLMSLIAGSQECQTDSSYHWSNLDRNPPHVIVQYTEKGECVFQYLDFQYRVPEGHAFIALPPENSSYWYPENSSKTYVLDWITLQGGDAIRIAGHIREQHGSVIQFKQGSESLLLFKSIIHAQLKAEFRDRFQQSEKLYAMLMAILRDQSLMAEIRDPVVFCFNYIHDHFRINFNIKQLALDAGISREHLTREFTSRYGQSPAMLLRHIRLQTARNQLLAGQQNLEDIARSCGLGSARNLSRIFLQLHKQTPDQFRKQSSLTLQKPY